MVAFKRLPFAVGTSTFLAQKGVTGKAIKLQWPLFLTVPTMQRIIFLCCTTIGLYNLHHLFVEKIGWEAVNVAVRTLGDLTTCKAT